MDYTKDIEIDESALDVEWLNQPKLAMKYSQYYAECFKKKQQAEENIKVIRAELIKKANENPDEYLGDGVKPTVATVEAYFRTHKKHIAAKDAWIEACFQLNIAEAAKWEVSNSRKAALQNLVELHGQNYFAGPNVPRDLSHEVIAFEQQKKANQKVKFTRKL
jgi:hypothetical protein